MRIDRLGLVLAVALSACDILGIGVDRSIGQVWPGNPDFVPLSTPDTVEVARPFSVTVTTLGGGCTSPGDTFLDVEGNVATVIPFDLHRSGNCTSSLGALKHEATITFPRRGDALVSLLAEDFLGDTIIKIDHPIWVR